MNTNILLYLSKLNHPYQAFLTQCHGDRSLHYPEIFQIGGVGKEYIKKKLHPLKGMEFGVKDGDDLLSHTKCAVPSALAVLTSLFGKGRGGTPPQ